MYITLDLLISDFVYCSFGFACSKLFLVIRVLGSLECVF